MTHSFDGIIKIDDREYKCRWEINIRRWPILGRQAELCDILRGYALYGTGGALGEESEISIEAFIGMEAEDEYLWGIATKSLSLIGEEALREVGMFQLTEKGERIEYAMPGGGKIKTFCSLGEVRQRAGIPYRIIFRSLESRDLQWFDRKEDKELAKEVERMNLR